MSTFLDRLAAAILSDRNDLSDVAVVLPSQRAGLYLRHALARAAGGPLWSPQLLTLGSFMEQLSGSRTMPMEQLLFEGYAAYRAVAGNEARELGDFLQWGPTALHDISEADAHLVPLDGFYRDLRSWEELDWSFNDMPLSPGQERMVRYWTMMGRMHAALNARLLDKGAGTAGLVERTAAERRPSPPWERVWFAGSNAFTPAQERVLAYLQELGVARFAWDADRYYLDDRRQEAGMHLRKAIERFGAGELPPIDRLKGEGPRVQVWKTPSDAAQAWAAATSLIGTDAEDRTRTAIVLADEGLLQPLLEALPTELGALNVTMGLPVSALPIGGLLRAFHQVHAGRRTTGWFHADLDRLLGHPFLRHGAGASGIDAFLSGPGSGQQAFVPDASLRAALRELPQPLAGHAEAALAPVEDVRTDMPRRSDHLLAWARLTMAHDAFATEQIYQASVALRRIHQALAEQDVLLDPAAYVLLQERVLRTAQVGLFGEPLQGVQVMGALEARALSPERLVVLGAQEGVLPSSSADRSFVPFELRRAYGLPLRDSTEAVQAYNFLRLLQGAQEVVLVHAEGEAAPGPSRFILQLQHELFDAAPERFEEVDVDVPVPVRASRSIAVRKDPRIIAAFRAALEKGLSPTAIGDWLRCPLDFWYKHILRLREPDVPGPRIGSNVLGEALHAAVEHLYAPWLGSPLRAADLEAAVAQVPDALRQALASAMPASTIEQGQPLLQFNMAVHAAQRFLRNEAREVAQGRRIVPLALERELSAEVPGAPSTIGVQLRLKGRIDRLDERDGGIVLLDLKTGRVEQSALDLKELSLDALRGDKRYAAQLLVYAWLHMRAEQDVNGLRAGLLPLQRASASKGLFVRVNGEEHLHRALLPALEGLFLDIAREMLDETVPLRHDPDSRYCRFCLG
ncbi:MAG: PD-(D/E)XK nuclease family protein [Flavobacteriales bacterium]